LCSGRPGREEPLVGCMLRFPVHRQSTPTRFPEPVTPGPPSFLLCPGKVTNPQRPREPLVAKNVRICVPTRPFLARHSRVPWGFAATLTGVRSKVRPFTMVSTESLRKHSCALHWRSRGLPFLALAGAGSAGAFEQDQRINSLTLQSGTDSFATNALGQAFTGVMVANLQTTINANLASGKVSLVSQAARVDRPERNQHAFPADWGRECQPGDSLEQPHCLFRWPDLDLVDGGPGSACMTTVCPRPR